MRRSTVIALLFCAAGCIKQAQQAIAPTPEGAGVSSCREIVETCDRDCTDPLCLNQCTEQGTAEAAPQHAALLDCGQRNGCMDEDCMRQKCPQEIETCMGPSPAPTSEPAGEPATDDTAPSGN